MPPTFDFDPVLMCTCHGCGVERGLPAPSEAKLVMRADTMLVLRATEACEACGDDRIAVRPDFELTCEEVDD